MNIRHTLLLLIALISTGVVAHGGEGDEVDFSRDIRPILSDNCFACHGPEEKSRKGGLRLDQKESPFQAADSGEIPIVPGSPEKSELLSRISSHDESVVMPPPESNKKLTAAQIQKLEAWIKVGAPWEDHWSFNTPKRPQVPEVTQPAWPKNEIDTFILARLDREKLNPSPVADRATLIRRVTFDLTGLPPTPEEVDAFIHNDSADAYEQLVDRLLASSRFGEHIARYWLDAARYGDTHGLHLDNYREMWPYRDWVIKSINNNMPYDQFVIEQLAGDLLPEPTKDQVIATGFNRCNVSTSEGGSIAEEVKMRNVVDRVDTVGTVFMGLTFECTRCHDHKFDPLTQKDFYSVYAFFNSIDGNPLDGNKKDHEPILKVPTEDQEQKLDGYNQQLAQLEKEFNGAWPNLEAEQLAWETTALSEHPQVDVQWAVIEPSEYKATNGSELKLLEDRSLLASGPNPATEIYTIQAQLQGAGWRGIQLEGLIDPSLTEGGAGRSSNSNVVLTEFEVLIAPLSNDAQQVEWKTVEFSKAWADHEQSNGDFKIVNAIDGKPNTGWAIEGFAKRENRKAIFESNEPFGFEEGTQIKVVIKHESQYGQHQFGRVRLSATTEHAIPVDIPGDILEIVRIPKETRDAPQVKKLQEHFRANVTKDAGYITLRDEVAKVIKERDAFDNSIATTMIWKEKKEPEAAHILTRGEYDQPADVVPRATPPMLPPMKEEWSKDRLGFAQWLVSPEHPLMARVTVNRFWQQFFGTGLVKTSEDFGSQGEPPSHPKLLDWLAVQFIEDGWDVKRTMKRMVMSATYQQSSKITPDLLKHDAPNRLMARGPRFRLDAEMLRDQALFVSGLLIEKQGGPSVKPPQPDGLWFAVGYSGSNTVRFKADEGPEKVHRRTLYTFIKRTAPPPQMNTFDGPSRESCTVRRERTNTPLQALLLFNDPQYIEAATALAARTMREGGETTHSRAERMLRLALGRSVVEEEIQRLATGYEEDLKTFQANPKAAHQLISIGIVPMEENYGPAELAAWTMAANLLLNLDEVVTKN